MIQFLINFALFFLVFLFGKLLGQAEGRLLLIQQFKDDKKIYDRIMKLAEFKGEDTSKFTDQEIVAKILKFKQDEKNGNYS